MALAGKQFCGKLPLHLSPRQKLTACSMKLPLIDSVRRSSSGVRRLAVEDASRVFLRDPSRRSDAAACVRDLGDAIQRIADAVNSARSGW